MKELKRFPISKLRNAEIYDLIEESLTVLNKHDLEALHLQDVYTDLLMHKPIAKTFLISKGKHPVTSVLTKLHKRRLMYASLINANVKAMLNEDDKALQYKAQLARRQTKKHLTYLGQLNREFVGARIFSFFIEVNGTENLTGDAFEALGLRHYLNELEKANTEYFELFDKRKNDLEKNSKSDNPEKRRKALWILRLFLEKVDANKSTYKDVDYSQLIHELNIILTANSKRIKTRIATNKRRARKKAEQATEATVIKNNTESEVVAKSSAQIKAKEERREKREEKKKIATTHKKTKPKHGTKRQPIGTKNLMKVLKQGEGKRGRDT